MAVYGTVARGYDADYPKRQAARGAAAEALKGGGYYQAAVDAGEPPGTWAGPGSAALGLEPGSVIDHDAHDVLFRERKGPDGTKLGRAPIQGGQSVKDVYIRLLAAEPEAGPARRRELQLQAQRQGKTAPLYYDVPMNLSKSLSVLHASMGVNMREAQTRGDAEDAAQWAGRIEEMDAMIASANTAALDYLQREAGYVRTGTHAGKVDGQQTGQWREADLVAASWYQHTSRDGDPHLHVHNQILHTARTRADGKWRAPDPRGYFEHVRAASSVFARHLEAALTSRFGLEWIERPDGQGYEIKGVSQKAMDAFSSRRDEVSDEMLSRIVPQFFAEHGRAPTQAELPRLRREAGYATRSSKPEKVTDWDATHAGWAEKLARTAGEDLGSIARQVMNEDPCAAQELTEAQVQRAASKALARAAREKSHWTRADLLAHIGRVLPPVAGDPQAQAELAEEVTDRALSGEFGTVTCLEAPSVVELPDQLIREDGRSAYQRHGTARYATSGQLRAEERLAELSQRKAPGLDPQFVADQLGASREELEAALAGRAGDLTRVLPKMGLRIDQAAVAYHQLTSPEMVGLINAPPGSGKTTVAGAIAKIATAAGRHVIGVTPSQSSRNTLARGVPESYNFAQFLGDLPGRPGARGHVPVGQYAVLLVDEASMLDTRVMLKMSEIAASRRAKLIMAGDTEQLTAVEHGGGMRLVNSATGHDRLTEPVRFKAAWEREASLRLRGGDPAVLTEYADQGRIRPGSYEEILDTAARAYVARTLEGRDVLMNVRDHGTRQELNRRIRGELRHLGLVEHGRAAVISDSQKATRGDLVFCKVNDNKQPVGHKDLTLANGQFFRVEAVAENGAMTLCLVLDANPDTGERRYSERTFTYRGPAEFDLGYAVTTHAAQSRTVFSGMEVITGNEDKQGELVGLTRGTTENMAFVATPSPRIADPKPTTRPAPELDRAKRLESERQGRTALEGDARLSQEHADEQLQAAIGVLASVMERDGAELSAAEYRDRELSEADHLGKLHAMWLDTTWRSHATRYQRMLDATLPEEYHGDPSPQIRWLFRTLRSAELAGMDAEAVLREAVASSSLAGSRDVASVVDARVRRMVGSAVPQPVVPWAEQVPEIPDPRMQQFGHDLASAMDDRRERIGEHAAEAALSWATGALGPVPEDPVERLDWERRAGAIGAYRQVFGLEDHAELLGPEPPAGDLPDKRAMWHEAYRALGPVPGTDLRGREDGSLWLMRDQYQAETSWAPRFVAPALGQVRRQAQDTAMDAVTSDAESRAAAEAGNQALAERHARRAELSRQRGALYEAQAEVLAVADARHREWMQATDGQRRLAVAADSELRRRHPELEIEALRSAEPEPVSEPEREESARGDKLPEWITRLDEASKAAEEELEARRGVRVPDEDPDYEAGEEAFPETQARTDEPIIQPPPPQMPPAERVLEYQAEPG